MCQWGQAGRRSSLAQMTVASWILEPEYRTKRNPKIIVGATIGINFVSGLQAQADRAEGPFDSGRRIDRGVQVACAQAKDRAGHVAVWQQAGTQAEVHESRFQGNEGPNSTTTGLKLGTEHAVGHS